MSSKKSINNILYFLAAILLASCTTTSKPTLDDKLSFVEAGKADAFYLKAETRCGTLYASDDLTARGIVFTLTNCAITRPRWNIPYTGASGEMACSYRIEDAKNPNLTALKKAIPELIGETVCARGVYEGLGQMYFWEFVNYENRYKLRDR